jgi:hypothetical protein
MLSYKHNTRRYLALKLRDVYEISATDMVVVKSLTVCLLNKTKEISNEDRSINRGKVLRHQKGTTLDSRVYAKKLPLFQFALSNLRLQTKTKTCMQNFTCCFKFTVLSSDETLLSSL